MAYVKNPGEDDELDPYAQQQAASQSSTGSSAYSTDPTPAGSGSMGPSAQDQTNTGSGFVNIDKYKTANRSGNEALAKTIGDKAAGELKGAQDELGKLNTDVGSGAQASDGLLSSLSGLRGSLSSDQQAELNKVQAGYQGPQSLNTSAYDAAYDSGYNKAKSYADRNVQIAALQDIFNTPELRQKGITYDSKMGQLDAALIDDNQDAVNKAVEDSAQSVRDAAKVKNDSFEASKRQAIKNSQEAQAKVQAAATAGRNKLVQSNETELRRMGVLPDLSGKFTDLTGALAQPQNKVLTDRGAAASMGDVVDNNELAAASVFDSILGGRTFNNLDKTYRDPTYQDVAPVNQGEIHHESVPGLDYKVEDVGPKYWQPGEGPAQEIPGTGPEPVPTPAIPPDTISSTIQKYLKKNKNSSIQ